MQGQNMMTSISTGRQLVKGAAILGVAAAISKIIGTLQKIPLQNIAGDSTFGIYSAVYPFYTLILVLATAGFPAAVSKFVSEKAVEGDIHGARRILFVSLWLMAFTGAASFAILFLGAGWISSLMGNRETELAIRAVSFALLFVPAMAALRGYFQGFQHMTPTAVSQVVEQCMRVAAMLALLLFLVSSGYAENWVAAGATFGSAVGALFGLAVMMYYWVKEQRFGILTKRIQSVKGTKDTYTRIARKLIWFAIPVCLGAMVLPLLNIIDAFTIMRLLTHQGFTDIRAAAEFGIYNRGLPLVQLVAMLFGSVSVAILPAVSEAKAREDEQGLKKRAEIPLRLTWVIGLASSIGLCILARPLNVMFFTDEAGTDVMAVLAFTAVFSVVNIVTGSILQGIGEAHLPALNLLAAALVKFGLNVALVPELGIMGAAISTVIAFAAAAIFNLIALMRHLRLELSFRTYVICPLLSVLTMSLVLLVLMSGSEAALQLQSGFMSERMFITLTTLLMVVFGAIIYIAVLLRSGALSEHEFSYIPGFNERWRACLRRLRLLG